MRSARLIPNGDVVELPCTWLAVARHSKAGSPDTARQGSAYQLELVCSNEARLISARTSQLKIIGIFSANQDAHPICQNPCEVICQREVYSNVSRENRHVNGSGRHAYPCKLWDLC